MITTAILLAGGPVDDSAKDESHHSLPRALTVVNDKPLILDTIDLLKKHGFTNLIVATNPAGRAIAELLGDGHKYGMTFSYLYEDQPLGTAGAVKRAVDHINDATFLIMAGDILTTIDLTEFVNFHHHYQALVTMAVKPLPTQQSFDNVLVQGHTVVDFRASQPGEVVSIVNTGIYLFEAEVVKLIPDHRPAELERDVFPQLAQTGKILAYPFQGVWFDVSSDTSYQKISKQEREAA